MFISILSLIYAVIIGAFSRRFQGGLLSQWVGPIGGTQVARLIGAVMVASIVFFLSGNWLWAFGTVVAIFLGSTFGFPTGMLPRSPHPYVLVPGNVVVNTFGICLHGGLAVMVLSIGAEYVGLSPWWILAAGMLRGPAYLGATFWTPHIPSLGMINQMKQGGPIDPPAFAEFISGGLLGLAIWLTL